MEEFIHRYGRYDLDAANEDKQKRKFVFVVSATSLKIARFLRAETFLGLIDI